MPNTTTSQDTTTETSVETDGPEETAGRLAYVEADNTVHTDNCAIVTKLLASDNPDDRARFTTQPLDGVIELIDNGLPTDLTECRACDKLRAAAEESAQPGAPGDPKETPMPTKTPTKIDIPKSVKPNSSIMAVVKALEDNEYGSGTTAEIAKAAGITAASANSALLALESGGLMVHLDTGTGAKKVRTWGLKGKSAPAKKTAAEIAATMAAKPKPAPAQKKTAAAPAKATAVKAAGTATSTRVSTGVRQEKSLEVLMKHPDTALSVLFVEQQCGYPVKTLAGVLARMAERPELNVVRADTENGRRGFMYKTPKAVKAAK